MRELLTVKLEVMAFARREDQLWVAGCPALDVFSQGPSEEEAKANLREALELWVESCVERDTLVAAFQELGWTTVAGAALVPPPRPASGFAAENEGSRPYALEVEVPAFQAAFVAA